MSANFDYHPDGQIASVTYADGRRENYLWDGLALIHRNGTDILNEPAITGGNPVLFGDKVLFNDLLGNTLGVKDQSSYQPIRIQSSYQPIRMTAFGESDNADAFFTGKPLVGELGYTFLFRNYRPEQGKWQTSDPLGYPDGWNNFAYCNNNTIMLIDRLGLDTILTQMNQAARNPYITPEQRQQAAAARDAYVLQNNGSSALTEYLSAVAETVSALNDQVQSITDSEFKVAKDVMNTLDQIASAGDNIAQMVNNAMNNDAHFLGNMIDLATGVLPIPPGVSDYLDFMGSAVGAIADGLDQIATTNAQRYTNQLPNCTSDEFDTLLGGFLNSLGLHDAYNRRLNQLRE